MLEAEASTPSTNSTMPVINPIRIPLWMFAPHPSRGA
jgi:hypothetical protein